MLQNLFKVLSGFHNYLMDSVQLNFAISLSHSTGAVLYYSCLLPSHDYWISTRTMFTVVSPGLDSAVDRYVIEMG